MSQPVSDSGTPSPSVDGGSSDGGSSGGWMSTGGGSSGGWMSTGGGGSGGGASAGGVSSIASSVSSGGAAKPRNGNITSRHKSSNETTPGVLGRASAMDRKRFLSARSGLR